MLTLGLMSGTSMDAVDGALVDWSESVPQTLAFASLPMAPALRAELFALQAPGPDELHRAALAAQGLARAYATVVSALMPALPAGRAVAAIGAHGQTVRHRPEDGYTWQLLDAALLAELTGLPVIANFRNADIAAGGQGAPLVPAFHAQVFRDAKARRAIVNLGGIANVSLLTPEGEVSGYDTGPANLLLDLWAERVTGAPMDVDGRLAAQGQVDPDLLAKLLDEPYFDLPAPKSTGRDRFHAQWLDRRLDEKTDLPGTAQRAADIQATLVELTAVTVARACTSFGAASVLLCGGGSANPVLVGRLQALCAPARVASTATQGAPPQAVEAVAFAWLARQRLLEQPGNLPAVTGARGLRVLGAIYPRLPI